MRFKLNLATRTYVDRKKANTLSAIMVVVAGLMLLLGVQGVGSHIGDISRLKADVDVLDGKFKSSGKGVNEADYNALLKEISAANSIIDKKTYDWLWLLDRLEEVVPDGVSLNSVDPSLKDNSLKISGAGRGFGNLRQLLENLDGSTIFSDVFLVSQAVLAHKQQTTAVSFTITAKVNYPKR